MFHPAPQRRFVLPLLKGQEAVRTAIARRPVLRVGGIGQVRVVARDDALAVATGAQGRVVGVWHGSMAARRLATARSDAGGIPQFRCFCLHPLRPITKPACSRCLNLKVRKSCSLLGLNLFWIVGCFLTNRCNSPTVLTAIQSINVLYCSSK